MRVLEDVDLRTRAEVARHLAEMAGQFCLERQSSLKSHDVEMKGIADPVSVVDRAAEQMIREELQLKYPEESVVGEEFGGKLTDQCWVVDPLDGTANYVADLPFWGVSIAWVSNGKPLIGAIALPRMGILLSGGLGLGILGLQDQGSRSVHLFAVGRNRRWSRTDRQATESMIEQQGQTVVSYGAASVAIAFALQGRLAGFVEGKTHIWDCAAGAALGSELGMRNKIIGKGTIVDFELRTLHRSFSDG